jgi:hypothetical protein
MAASTQRSISIINSGQPGTRLALRNRYWVLPKPETVLLQRSNVTVSTKNLQFWEPDPKAEFEPHYPIDVPRINQPNVSLDYSLSRKEVFGEDDPKIVAQVLESTPYELASRL